MGLVNSTGFFINNPSPTAYLNTILSNRLIALTVRGANFEPSTFPDLLNFTKYSCRPTRVKALNLVEAR